MTKRKVLPSRAESFWMGVIVGSICTLAFFPVPAKAADDGQQHYFGLNLVSRHFTTNNERYCETNPGVFYERRWGEGGAKGLQVGYYRNSFCKLETKDRIDDTFYAVGIYQPWTVFTSDVKVGGFAGPASGYRKGNLTLIAGGIVTWQVMPRIALQGIVNPAVAALQVRIGF